MKKSSRKPTSPLDWIKQLDPDAIAAAREEVLTDAYFDCPRLPSIPQGVLCHDVSGVT